MGVYHDVDRRTGRTSSAHLMKHNEMMMRAVVVLWALLGAAAAAVNITRRSLIPVHLDVGSVKGPGGLAGMGVTLCALDWEAYRRDPTVTPMFRDLTMASGCSGMSAHVERVTFGDLEAEWRERGCDSTTASAPDASGCRPSGIVFHESRCGSTLSANMLAVASPTLVYSEPGLDGNILSLVEAGQITPEEYVHVVRVIFAAMARPIWAAATGAPIERSGPAGAWAPKYLFIKHRSSVAPLIGSFRASFPSTPWLFMFRDGVEVMMSLLRNAPLIPASGEPGAPLVVDNTANVLRMSPCLRARGSSRITPFVLTTIGASSPKDSASTPAEKFCAVAVAELVSFALVQAGDARGAALAPLWEKYVDASNAVVAAAGALAAADDRSWLDGRSVGEVIRASPALSQLLELDAAHGALLDKATHRGIVNGIGQAVFVDYHAGAAAANSSSSGGSGGGEEGGDDGALYDTLLALFQGHLAPAPGWLSASDLTSMKAWSARYSKARGATMDAATGEIISTNARGGGKMMGFPGASGVKALGGRLHKPSLDEQGNFVADSGTKQGKAWQALKEATATYVTPLEAFARRFNVDDGTASGGGASSSVSGGAPAAVTAATTGAATAHTSGARVTAAADGSSASGTSGSGTADPSFDVRLLPLHAGYPATYPLRDILNDWNPDIVTVPTHYGKYSSLRVFDARIPGDMEEALLYRRAEVPFILQNALGISGAVSKWWRDEYLIDVAGGASYDTEANDNAHFMYYNRGAGKGKRGRPGEGAAPPQQPRDWKPPTSQVQMSMPSWLTAAHTTEAEILAEEAAVLPAGWAPPAGSTPIGVGLNNMTDDGVPVPPRAVRTAPPHMLTAAPPDALAVGGGTRGYSTIYGRTLAQRLQQRGGGAGGVATSTSVPRAPRLSRAKRMMYYLRASALLQGQLGRNTWITQ